MHVLASRKVFADWLQRAPASPPNILLALAFNNILYYNCTFCLGKDIRCPATLVTRRCEQHLLYLIRVHAKTRAFASPGAAAPSLSRSTPAYLRQSACLVTCNDGGISQVLNDVCALDEHIAVPQA
jgi:hypothetical protein